MTSPGNLDIEKSLDELPDQVADALEKWRIATLEREKTEALLYAKYKGGIVPLTAPEIKALINSSGERYAAVLNEIKSEANYKRLEEGLMAMKKRASLRVAY